MDDEKIARLIKERGGLQMVFTLLGETVVADLIETGIAKSKI